LGVSRGACTVRAIGRRAGCSPWCSTCGPQMVPNRHSSYSPASPRSGRRSRRGAGVNGGQRPSHSDAKRHLLRHRGVDDRLAGEGSPRRTIGFECDQPTSHPALRAAALIKGIGNADFAFGVQAVCGTEFAPRRLGLRGDRLVLLGLPPYPDQICQTAPAGATGERLPDHDWRRGMTGVRQGHGDTRTNPGWLAHEIQLAPERRPKATVKVCRLPGATFGFASRHPWLSRRSAQRLDHRLPLGGSLPPGLRALRAVGDRHPHSHRAS
jgi:hypothetical protein